MIGMEELSMVLSLRGACTHSYMCLLLSWVYPVEVLQPYLGSRLSNTFKQQQQQQAARSSRSSKQAGG